MACFLPGLFHQALSQRERYHSPLLVLLLLFHWRGTRDDSSKSSCQLRSISERIKEELACGIMTARIIYFSLSLCLFPSMHLQSNLGCGCSLTKKDHSTDAYIYSAKEFCDFFPVLLYFVLSVSLHCVFGSIWILIWSQYYCRNQQKQAKIWKYPTTRLQRLPHEKNIECNECTQWT